LPQKSDYEQKTKPQKGIKSTKTQQIASCAFLWRELLLKQSNAKLTQIEPQFDEARA
jgi:hypothetical protein